MVGPMVIAVRTERGPDGIEVVKEADTDDDRVRLADEAAVLRRAAHPGVVEVIEVSGSVLRLRHCGSPLSRLGPVAPDHAAAIVRAVAEIVDALHRQGIVHRRIDADHVAVSERGRPHLIGFGKAGDGDATEVGDDVAALGALLNRLLDDGTDALWSPAHRGVRAATRRKRAMAAFRTAASGAQRPDPAQRPSAHQLATAIGEALPGLTLPTPPGVDPDDPGPGGFAAIPHDIDPTDDLGWTDFDLSFLAVDDEVAPDEEIERNPAAPRDPYAVLESLASPEPEPEPEPDLELEVEIEVAESVDDEPEAIDDDPSPIVADIAEDEDVPEDDTDNAVDADDDDVDPIIAALRSAIAAESEPEPVVVAEPQPDPTPTPAPEPRELDPAPERLQPPSIQIRAGDADPTPQDRRGPSRRVLVAVAVVVAIVGAVAGSVIARAVDPFGAESASAAPETTTTIDTDSTSTGSSDTGTDGAGPVRPPIPDGCTPVDLRGPDLDENGCPGAITLDGRIATVGGVDIELGQEGDLVVVADNNCDGVATPVLLRPETGEVFDFPGWSLDEAIEVTASTIVDDAVSIDVGSGDCPEVFVTDTAGDQTVVAP